MLLRPQFDPCASRHENRRNLFLEGRARLFHRPIALHQLPIPSRKSNLALLKCALGAIAVFPCLKSAGLRATLLVSPEQAKSLAIFCNTSDKRPFAFEDEDHRLIHPASTRPRRPIVCSYQKVLSNFIRYGIRTRHPCLALTLVFCGILSSSGKRRYLQSSLDR
jgi:hypothetical protein